MARLLVSPQVPTGPYPATPLAPGSADLVFTPAGADYLDGAGVTMSGSDLVIVRNAGIDMATVTIYSVPDTYNRSGHISAYPLDPGAVAVFGPFARPGWMQPDGQLYLEADAPTVEFAVLAVP